MSVRYLLDTNILSEAIRPRPAPAVLRQIERHAGRLATSSVVWNELWYGLERLPRSKRRNQIEEYLLKLEGTGLPVLPFDQVTARWHARERARLARAGTPVPFEDGMTGAVAVVNGLVMVTRNIKHFENIDDIELENWFEE